MKWVGFDLEIANEFPDEGNPLDADLGITCASTVTSDGEVVTWPAPCHMVGSRAGAMYPARLSTDMCAAIVGRLLEYDYKGYRIITWNGLGFDFPLLAIECHNDGLTALIKGLATNHIDIGFQMLCEKGFMCGLNAAAKGLKLEGKTEGMHGDLAPAMWKESREKQDLVLEYVAQDSRTTGEVYEGILDQGGSLVWITKKGYPTRRAWFPTLRGNQYGVRLLKVAEALALPLPDTSWMDEAWPRSKFSGWLTL